MAKVSVLFLVVCAACLLDKSIGNYYWQTNPSSGDLLSYSYLSPYSAIWQPVHDKSENSEESSNSESSSSESSSSESSSSESSESTSREGSSSESSSEESKKSEEGGGSTEESKSSSEESEASSSTEKGGSKSSEESSEGSGEKKKEAPKKKKKKESKSPFPHRHHTFPQRRVQQIIYSPSSPYAYMPYRSSYIVQQPVASYPAKSGYQYLSVPASAAVSSSYTTSPVAGKMVNSPVQKIVYSTSSALNYQPVPKIVMPPGARVYSVPGSWNSPLSYLKK